MPRGNLHRARRAPLVVSSGRTSEWLFVDVDSVLVGGAANVLVASFNAAALAARPFTIVRTYLEVLWRSDQGAASEQPLGALGFIIVNEQAVAAGGGSIPDPMADANASWYVWQGLISEFVFASAVGFNEGAAAGSRYHIDSKAMRKVSVNEDLAIVVENTAAAAIGGVISIQGRMLIKNH